MKKFFDWRILIIIILVIVLGIMLKMYVSNKDNSQITPNISSPDRNEKSNFYNMKDGANNENTSKILKTTSEIISELNENVELHATYYLSKCYVETNQEVKKEKIF